MKIAVIQASSQKEKNALLYESIKEAVQKNAYEVINFGVFENEEANYSYIEIAIQIGLLIESGAVDFVVTGCSSGQGMMLACNTLPDLCCGYIVSPSDAYLFGRINDGNAVSFPLGLHFGWAGELNLKLEGTYQKFSISVFKKCKSKKYYATLVSGAIKEWRKYAG